MAISPLRDFLRRRQQLLAFLVVGVLSAALDVGLLKLLLLKGAPVLAATSAAFVAGLLFNLCCHARYTFGSALDAATVLRYLCLVALTYAMTLGCVAAALALGADPLWGKLAAMVAAPVIGYLGGKYWVFRPHRT